MKSKQPLFNKICIVGVGLIGGSLGMAIKKKGLARWVIGVSRKDSTLKSAVALNAIDIGTTDLKIGIKDADLVILCGPVSVIQEQLKTIGKFLSKKTIVVDAGSSKLQICQTASKFLKKNKFIGCHPMAGSERTGVEHACADLFEGSVCFVSSKNTIVENFWKKLGSKPIIIPAAEHDRIVAQISHIPHALSFSLFQTPKKIFPGTPVNPSLREFRRLAQSSPDMWADIFISNADQV